MDRFQRPSVAPTVLSPTEYATVDQVEDGRGNGDFRADRGTETASSEERDPRHSPDADRECLFDRYRGTYPCENEAESTSVRGT